MKAISREGFLPWSRLNRLNHRARNGDMVNRCERKPRPSPDPVYGRHTPESGTLDFPINLNLRRCFVLAHNRAFHLPKQFRNDAGER